MLREVSNTTIAFIPKTISPSSLQDFQVILYCNTIYKCIAKILASRIASVQPLLISKEQSAFIPKQQIADNILLAQELVHAYQSRKGPPRCALKVDIMKVFDSIKWDVLRTVIKVFSFPQWLVSRVMEYITSAHFSISLNGKFIGFLFTTRGPCQGDPLSLFLFVLAMEVFFGLMRQNETKQDFKYHW